MPAASWSSVSWRRGGRCIIAGASDNADARVIMTNGRAGVFHGQQLLLTWEITDTRRRRSRPGAPSAVDRRHAMTTALRWSRKGMIALSSVFTGTTRLSVSKRCCRHSFIHSFIYSPNAIKTKHNKITQLGITTRQRICTYRSHQNNNKATVYTVYSNNCIKSID